MTTPNVFVAGSFLDLQAATIRFLAEAAKLGSVHVLLWPDPQNVARSVDPPAFTMEERIYILENTRYVTAVMIAERGTGPSALPLQGKIRPDIWAVDDRMDEEARRAFCQRHDIRYRVVRADDLMGFPSIPPPHQPAGRKKVLVTGCFDWFHAGHVRFFEEASTYGDLYVVVGSDDNLRRLKGPRHPLFSQEERRYVVQSVRFVSHALISTGVGWMDAEPEIARIRPDMYLVNEDGDHPEKRRYCEQNGLEYVVLKREPKPGLPSRRSTDLRGF